MLRKYVQTIKVGEEPAFPFNGNYVRLISSLVTITCTTNNGDEFELAAGEEAQLDNFEILRVRHASGVDQAISFYIGKGDVKVGSAKIGGIVEVSNFPATPTGYNVNNWDENRIEYGASFASTANLAINTAQAIFLPAANVNGAILHAALCKGYSTGDFIAIIAKTSAPTSVTDGDVLNMDVNQPYQNGSYRLTTKVDKNVFIPAGKGVYFICDAALSISNRSALYTLLP